MAKSITTTRRLLPPLEGLRPVPHRATLKTAAGKELNIRDLIEDLEVRLTMERASTLTARIADPAGKLLASEALQEDLRLTFPEPRYVESWRLWQSRGIGAVGREADVTVLTFWDAGSAALKRVVEPLSRSAASLNWEGWVRLNASQAKRDYQMGVVVPRPNSTPPRVTNDGAETTAGWSTETRKKVTIKGRPASADQLKEIDTALKRAVKEKAPALAVLAMCCAGIGESEFKAIMNLGGSPYGGVFQGNVRDGTWELNDTDGMAGAFLKGGKGFQGGGAIALAREHRDWSPGKIALTVEGSRANFGSDAAAERHYDQHRREAKDMIELWSGVTLDKWRTVTGPAGTDDDYGDTNTARPTEWRRGRPGVKESALKALSRDAEGLGQRAFVAARNLVAGRDQDLILGAPHLTIDFLSDSILSELPSVEIGSNTVTLRVEAAQWSAPPGSVAALKNAPAFPPNWLVQSVTATALLDTAEVVLQQPTTKIPKPPTRRVDEDAANEVNTGGGAPIEAGSLAYPLAKRGTNGGGPAAHRARAWGNWQSDNAIDINVPLGTRVFAVDDGEITKLGGSWKGGADNPDGFNITLTTSDNVWFYTHNSRRVALEVGQKVKKGDYLGLSGAANGVKHLHIACKNGNPETLLWERAREVSSGSPSNDAATDRGGGPRDF